MATLVEAWSVVPVFAYSEKSERLISVLMDRIDDKEFFKKEKVARINDLKKRIASEESRGDNAYQEYNDLIAEYFSFNSDSTEHYLRKVMDLNVRMHDREAWLRNYLLIAWNNVQNGKILDANNILNDISREDIEKYSDIKRRYYDTKWSFFNDYSYVYSDSSVYARKRLAYRDSLLSVCSPEEDLYKYVSYEKMLEEGRYEEAKALIQPLFDRNDTGGGRAAYCLATICRKEGDRDNTKYYLAYAASLDLFNAVLENKAMRELGLMLYEDGDVDRAYKCLNSSLEDALEYDARAKVLQIVNDFPTIRNSYMSKIEKEKNISLGLLILSVCLLIGLALQIIYLAKQMRELNRARSIQREMNHQLQMLNAELSQSNEIKDKYIVQFLEICSDYIEKLNNYRFSLLRIANVGKFSELTSKLRSDEWVDAEISSLLKQFDSVFLSIVPGFIPGVNALMKPECQFDENAESLNTELRILALVRLGITDSTLIARFLRYSVTTIYNYRVKLRNNAVCPREEFDKNVSEIGLMYL